MVIRPLFHRSVGCIFSMDEMALLDATAQAELVRKGEITPRDLVDFAIARIEKLNPSINAVVNHLFEEARAQAASDQLPDGPFRGVPTLMKDMSAATAGMPSYQGNRILKEIDHRAKADTPVGKRIRGAGFVVLGKTNTPEFGLQPTTQPLSFGPTRNPYDLDRSPSGSSGGAAAAVASGMVAIAHASDGGGSIRNPASWCGLVGLKGTRGRVSRGPLIGRLGQELFVTRTVRDTALALDALHGSEPGDLFTVEPPVRPYVEEVGAPPGSLRIGLMVDVDMEVGVDPRCVDAATAVAKLLESLGHIVEEAHPERMFDNDFLLNAETDYSCGLNATVDALWGLIGRDVDEADFEPYTWARMSRHASTLSSAQIRSATWLQRYASRISKWWRSGYDLLLTPTTGEPPALLEELVPPHGDPWSIDRNRFARVRCFARPLNVTGHPAISLPLGWTDEGLPMGMQLVADFGREDILIRVASQLEEVEPWAPRQSALISVGFAR